MKRTATRHLLTYWAELRADPENADRAASASTAMQFAVSQSFLMEAYAARDFPLRISGLRIDRLFLGCMRDVGFLNLWRQSDRAAVADVLMTSMVQALPVVAGVSAAPAGREPMKLELILLPLSRRGQTDGLLGGLTPAANAPWCGIEAVTSFTLGPWRFLDQPIGRAPRPASARRSSIPAQAAVRRSQFAVINGGLSATVGRSYK